MKTITFLLGQIVTRTIDAKDTVLVKMANFLLRFTSKYHQDMLKGSIEYGIRSAHRDILEGRESPPPVQKTKGD